MLLSAVSVLVVAQSSSEIPEGLMNNPVYLELRKVQPNTAETLHHNSSLINVHRSQCYSCTISNIPQNNTSISVQQRNNF